MEVISKLLKASTMTSTNPKPTLLYYDIVTKQVTREVVSNPELSAQFQAFVGLHQQQGSICESCCKLLFKEIVGRVVNVMSNSFMHSQDVIQRIAERKGVDAQLSLWDKLKACASDKAHY